METQTHYDLNAAIENWRQELVVQPNLTPEVRRELETHLRDAIAGFQQRGLSHEESFWLARKRVGQPQQLGNEFIKVDPAKVWRERVFWMVLACLIVSLWVNLVSCIQLHHWLDNGWFGLFTVYSHILLYYLPPLGMAIFLATGRLNGRFSVLGTIFQSRWVFAISAIVFIILTQGIQAVMQYRFLIQTDHGRLTHTLDGFSVNIFSTMSWPLMLVLLCVWLLPPKGKESFKRD